MKQISTPATNSELKAADDKECEQQGAIDHGALYIPSERCTRNIMAFSRSFDVMKSQLLGHIEIFRN